MSAGWGEPVRKVGAQYWGSLVKKESLGGMELILGAQSALGNGTGT